MQRFRLWCCILFFLILAAITPKPNAQPIVGDLMWSSPELNYDENTVELTLFMYSSLDLSFSLALVFPHPLSRSISFECIVSWDGFLDKSLPVDGLASQSRVDFDFSHTVNLDNTSSSQQFSAKFRFPMFLDPNAPARFPVFPTVFVVGTLIKITDYPFPGVSPITRRPEPLLQLYATSTINTLSLSIGEDHLGASCGLGTCGTETPPQHDPEAIWAFFSPPSATTYVFPEDAGQIIGKYSPLKSLYFRQPDALQNFMVEFDTIRNKNRAFFVKYTFPQFVEPGSSPQYAYSFVPSAIVRKVAIGPCLLTDQNGEGDILGTHLTGIIHQDPSPLFSLTCEITPQASFFEEPRLWSESRLIDTTMAQFAIELQLIRNDRISRVVYGNSLSAATFFAFIRPFTQLYGAINLYQLSPSSHLLPSDMNGSHFVPYLLSYTIPSPWPSVTVTFPQTLGNGADKIIKCYNSHTTISFELDENNSFDIQSGATTDNSSLAIMCVYYREVSGAIQPIESENQSQLIRFLSDAELKATILIDTIPVEISARFPSYIPLPSAKLNLGPNNSVGFAVDDFAHPHQIQIHVQLIKPNLHDNDPLSIFSRIDATSAFAYAFFVQSECSYAGNYSPPGIKQGGDITRLVAQLTPSSATSIDPVLPRLCSVLITTTIREEHAPSNPTLRTRWLDLADDFSRNFSTTRVAFWLNTPLSFPTGAYAAIYVPTLSGPQFFMNQNKPQSAATPTRLAVGETLTIHLCDPTWDPSDPLQLYIYTDKSAAPLRLQFGNHAGFSICVTGVPVFQVDPDLHGTQLFFRLTLGQYTRFSDLWLVSIPPGDAEIWVEPRSVIPFTPLGSVEPFSVMPTESRLELTLNFHERSTYTDRIISLVIPEWIELSSLHCLDENDNKSTPVHADLGNGGKVSFTLDPDFVPTSMVCLFEMRYVVSDVTKPIKTDFFPLDQITFQFKGDSSTDAKSLLWKPPTATFPNLGWLILSKAISCGTSETFGYGICDGNEILVDVEPPTPTTMPPLSPNPIPRPSGLAQRCDLVVSNKGHVEVFETHSHENMCSIPIAGKLVSHIVEYSQVGIAHVIDATDRFPSTQTEFSLCDCACLGYWRDDPNNDDEKKCSRCAVPDCPALLTPNSDCTACECVTPQCRRFRTYLFSTLYLDPTVLRYISLANPSPNFNTIPFTAKELDDFVLHPDKSHKAKYQSVMTAFATSFGKHITALIAKGPHGSFSSFFDSVSISPLVEGSFLVWKVTLSVVNNDESTPIASKSPLFGLPPLETHIGELFGRFYATKYLSTTDPEVLATLLKSKMHTPQLDFTPPSSSTPAPTPILKLFTSDAIRTGCLTHDQSLALGSDKPATLEMLQPCPLSSQYTVAPDHNTNPSKTDRLNPMWSPCATTPQSSPLQFAIDEYETLAQDGGPTKKSVSIRQLSPRCVDFANVDVGLSFHVGCSIDTSSLLYSTSTASILLPSYTSALLQSFSTLTLSPTAQGHIDKLRSGSSLRSSFPRFPSTTVAECPPVLPPARKKSKPVPPPQCPVGFYGPGCQLVNTVPPTSMTTSPPALSTNSHSHIQWAFMGDNTQDLTIVLQAANPVPSANSNDPSYFVWSQTLATVPIANLYASAQVPAVDRSLLFQTIYDAIAAGNTDFTKIYSSNTNIVVRGYLTRSATQRLDLDPADLADSGLTFTLPMLCTESKVTCHSPTSQFCHEYDGRCRCRAGFVDANPEQELRQNYVVKNGNNIDGDGLECVPICHNGGTWVGDKSVDKDTSEKKKICECLDGFFGDHCEIKNECQTSPPTPHPCGTSSNGFISFDLVSSSCKNNACQCLGQWTNHLETSLEVPTEETGPQSQSPPPCSLCALKPLSSQLYDSPAAFTEAREIYNSDPQLAPHNTQDEKYSQTYQPTTTAQAHPLTQQRCYIGGTDPLTYTVGQCTKCLCRRGYGGEWCQLHVAYANMTYTPRTNPNDKAYIYDALTETLLFDKIAEELALSMTNFDKSKLTVTKHDRKGHWLEVAVLTGVDFFARNKALIDVQPDPNEMLVQQQQPTNYDQWNTPPFGFDNMMPPNLDDLYAQWGNLNEQLPQTPITNQDSGQFLGEIGLPPVLDDPACAEQGWAQCSPPKRANSTGLIIGLVVGLGGAALLFLILVLILLWCRRNERGFWKSAEKQDRDEMSNFTLTPRNTFKGSTAAPVSTTSAVSVMPIGGLEMTGTDQSAANPSTIQSVNNHTEVKDPSLPSHIKGYKDVKGNVFYVNSEDMTTSWAHPNKTSSPNDDEAENEYGW